jgi:hypothetical protein
MSRRIFGKKTNEVRLGKSMIHPLGRVHIIDSEHKIGKLLFSNTEMDTLYDLNNDYIEPLSAKQYDKIVNDPSHYLDIYQTLSKIRLHTNDPGVDLMMKISLNGLQGTMNAFGLHVSNIELNLKNLILQKRVDNVLAGVNQMNIANTENIGQFQIEQSFSLAPLYSYYIMLFGIPSQKTGFDPAKLVIIRNVLSELE